MGEGDREVQVGLPATHFREVLNAVADSMTVQAPDGTLLLTNEAASRMLGMSSVAELMAASSSDLTARFELFDEDGEPMELERLPGRAALRGEEPPEMLVRWRLVGSGVEHFSLIKARPVRGPDGRVLFAVNVFRDVTERQRAVEALRASEARLAFLAEASRRLLTTSLQPHGVLDEVATLVVPELADWCAVREVNEDGVSERLTIGRLDLEGGEVTLRECEPDDPLAYLVAVDRPGKSHRLLIRDLFASPSPFPRELRKRAVLAQLGVRSLVTVPLRARDTSIGVLTLARGRDRQPYSEADLALAEEFGGRVAEAVSNARSYRRERATAEALARGLLPGRLPAIPGVEVAARYRATGDVGGDFYDCIPRGDGRWLLVVGDVCGRGIQAASMTGLTRHTIRATALHAPSPAAVLHDLNRLLIDAAGGERATATDLAWEPDVGPSFCTVCLAEVALIPGGARVVMTSGGHPLPFVIRGDGRVAAIGRPGSLVGVLTDLDVTEETIDLAQGDALVLFTDGITERRRKGRLFEDDLPATLHRAAGGSADEIAGWLERSALAYSSTVPDDDIAVLVLAIPPGPLPTDPPSTVEPQWSRSTP